MKLLREALILLRLRPRPLVAGKGYAAPGAEPFVTDPKPAGGLPNMQAAIDDLKTVKPHDHDVVKWGSVILKRRDVVRYVPPKGVLPERAQREALGEGMLAMDDGPGENYFGSPLVSNGFYGLGFPGYAYLSELSQRSEYRAPSETIAKEMTRKFIKFTTKAKGDKSVKFAELDAWYKKHDVRQVCRNALQLDLFMGRSQIFLKIKDDEDDATRALPLLIDPKTIKKGSFEGFRVIEPIWTTPLAYNSIDPTKPDFYRPEFWFVLGRKIHSSRLLTIISRPVPDILKPAYNFGGISLTQLMEPYVIRWLRTVDSVNRIINNYSIMILKTNMMATLQGNASGLSIRQRAELFTLTRDNQALHLIDKNGEEMQQVAVPLGSLDKLQAQAQEHMAAPSHIPLVKLTGITPSGLNASSEGEITAWHEFVNSEQEDVLEPVLDLILDLAQLDLYGSIDQEIDYDFVPLVEGTLKEIADIRKSDVDGAVALVGSNIITPDEARTTLASNPDSGYSNLTGPAPEPVEDPDADGIEGDPNAGGKPGAKD